MTSSLDPAENPTVMEVGTVVVDTDTDIDVIEVAVNGAAEAPAEELVAESSHTAATVNTTSDEKEEEAKQEEEKTTEEKEEEETKKKKRATGKKRTRRVGSMQPRKEAKLEDPSQAGGEDGSYKVQSKHDEKWNKMLEALIEYKKEFSSTMVPQCYDQDPRLGRWVHYQRGKYRTKYNDGICLLAPLVFMRCYLTIL
jgi:hypothetical protein